jgi:hypothetical protein
MTLKDLTLVIIMLAFLCFNRRGREGDEDFFCFNRGGLRQRKPGNDRRAPTVSGREKGI